VANQQLEPPTLSEIARRLDEMRDDLRAYASSTVPLAVYQADNIARDREAKEMKADISALQVKVDEERTKRDAAESSKRLMWITIIATPIAVLLINFVASGGIHVGP
jgi:hypothetical protein